MTVKLPGYEDDLCYQPELASLEVLAISLPLRRALVIGKTDELGPPSVDARSCRPPGPVMSTGTYLFRAADGWDAIVCNDGNQPGFPGTATDDADDTHHLVQARNWFDHLWEHAMALGPTPVFEVGDHVRLAGASQIGQVKDRHLVRDGWVYRVQVGQYPQQVSESGLLPVAFDPHDPEAWMDVGPATGRQFALTVTHTKLHNPLTDTVYSYLSSKTVFRSYQFRPVLRFLSSSHQRLLIADEVGLGKTIEAGLIWTELEQRNEVRRALVVCPAMLVPKWQAEMRRRFDRELRVLDKTALSELARLFRSGEDEKEFLGVVSLERLRNKKVLAELTETAPRFDLVIVDEAHYLRNRDTLSNALGRSLSEWADALIFLSATPLNLGRDDLFNLLNLLAEEEFSDPQVFSLQVEPNRHLNTVAAGLLADRTDPSRLVPELDRIRTCELGAAVTQRPEFDRLRGLLGLGVPLGWRQLAEAKRCLAELNTLSSLVTRTRRRDVPDAMAVREPMSIEVDWTPAEQNLYRAVETWARERARQLRVSPGFLTQMPLRQAASCLPVMGALLAVATKDPDGLRADEDFDDLDVVVDGEEEPLEVVALRQLQRSAAALDGVDTKFDQFHLALRKAQETGVQQVMVFSFFRRTLEYLQRRLAPEFTVRVMHGGVKLSERIEIMDSFREGAFDILLVSEVGSEGLDFEFCNVLVNYDLPWNPMRVEQRIGRLDRFGQRHEKIFIYNFHVPGTIETEIFQRLYDRINVFRESIGELEPILREEAMDLQRIALDPNLSAVQRQQEVDRVELAVEERSRQLDDVRNASAFLRGMDSLLIDGFDETRSRGRFVGPEELRYYLQAFLDDGTNASLRVTGPDRVELIGDSIVADRVARNSKGAGTGRYGIGALTTMLRDEEPIHATFSNEEASRTGLDLLSIRHPLLRSAVRHFGAAADDLRRYGAISLASDTLHGQYGVVIYLAETTGLNPSLELWPVAVNRSDGTISEDAGFALLAAVANGALGDGEPFDRGAMRRLLRTADEHALQLQLSLEKERRQLNEALVEARMATQEASFHRKIGRAKATLAKVTAARRDQSLLRLYRGQIANLDQRRRETLDGLDGSRQLALSIRPVALAALTFR